MVQERPTYHLSHAREKAMGGKGQLPLSRRPETVKLAVLVSILWDRLDMEWIVPEIIHMRPHSSHIATPSEQLNQVVFWRHIVSP